MEKRMCYVASQVISGCVKKRENNSLQCVTLFLFLPSCLPFASSGTVFSEPTVTLVLFWGKRGEEGLVMCVLASCSLWLSGLEHDCCRECGLLSSPPSLSCGKNADTNEHLAENPSRFKEEVPQIYDLPFLLKCKLETSWGTSTWGSGVGWVKGCWGGCLGRKNILHQLSGCGRPGWCCFLSWFSFVKGQWVWIIGWKLLSSWWLTRVQLNWPQENSVSQTPLANHLICPFPWSYFKL